MGMPDEQQPHRRTSHKAEAQEEDVQVEAQKQPGDPPGEDEGTSTEVEVPDYYPPRLYSPWELPANTVAAQQYIERGLLVDSSLVPSDDRLAAANNEIELYGHPDDPRLSGGDITTPLSAEALANPTRTVEIEEPVYVERDSRTWGQVQEAESEGEAETKEAKV